MSINTPVYLYWKYVSPTVPLRYDIYYLAEVVEPIAKPKELYAAIVAHIAATLPSAPLMISFSRRTLKLCGWK